MRPTDVAVHGTYPWDHADKWRRVRSLTLSEASELTGLTLDEPIHQERLQVGRDVYLWLNKGFIVLGDDAPRAGKSGLSLAIAEQFGSPEVAGIRVGANAVYLHDGQYSLLERIA